jgi:hypothetical protein
MYGLYASVRNEDNIPQDLTSINPLFLTELQSAKKGRIRSNIIWCFDSKRALPLVRWNRRDDQDAKEL